MTAPDTHQQAIERYENTVHALEDLIEVGISLSSDTDIVALTEHIFLEAKKYAHADGATLYIRTTDNMLEFVSMRSDSLGIASGGTTGTDIPLPAVALYLADGSPNNRQVASYSALQGEIVNIANLYENDQFDFEATKKFDAETGYRTVSFLTIPLKNTSQHVIGVLQLLNALDPDTGEVTAFPKEVIPYIRSLASQVAVAIEKQQLFDNQRKLLDSFIRLIGTAIDAKSKYTGGHCQRVPELVKMLTRAACDQSEGVFSDFELDEEGWYELHLGAWLHDCGKVTTPEYVVDKATKLETITDRIHEVRTRFEVVKRDETIKYLEAIIAGKDDPEKLKQQLQDRHKELDGEFAFLAECNIGTENMPDEWVTRLKQIANIHWYRTIDDRLGVSKMELARKQRTPVQPLPARETVLSDRPDHLIEHDVAVPAAAADNPHGFRVDVPQYKYNQGEIYNLSIQYGTLTREERFKISDHVMQTIVMLEELDFPIGLQNVPLYAGSHHERMDGNGYPRGITGEEMPVPSKIIAIADIYEALTAADRPYKAAKTQKEAIDIMAKMAEQGHIDGDLFRLFVSAGVYVEYASLYLQEFQIDKVDAALYL